MDLRERYRIQQKLPWKWIRPLELTEKEIEILNFIKDHPGCTRVDLKEHFNMTQSRLNPIMADMIRKNIPYLLIRQGYYGNGQFKPYGRTEYKHDIYTIQQQVDHTGTYYPEIK